jgi:hypothetical protein
MLQGSISRDAQTVGQEAKKKAFFAEQAGLWMNPCRMDAMPGF